MNELEQAILKNNLVLDCPVIILSKQTSDSDEEIYKGSGYISQVEGCFLLKLYLDEPLPAEEIFSSSRSRVGELIKDSEYFSISAFDMNDRNWKAKRLLINKHSNDKGCVITSEINELYFERELQEPLKCSILNMRFRDNIDFPCNATTESKKMVEGQEISGEWKRNIAKFSSCGINFELHKQEIGFEVKACSDTVSISEPIAVRITEGLQFIFAKSLSWVIQEMPHRISVTKIRSPFIGKDNARDFPPLSSMLYDSKDLWRLFDKYLNYVIQYNEITWHPLFMRIHKVIESWEAPLEAEALTLSVCLEGILKSEVADIFKADENLKNQIDKLIVVAGSAVFTEDFKKRLTGSLSNMLRPRAKDKLFILKEKGLIEESLIEAWDKLRNSSTHADSVNYEDLQTFLNLCKTVLVLFYKIIFLLIKYTGTYTDYSLYDYPTRMFSKSLCSLDKEENDLLKA